MKFANVTGSIRVFPVTPAADAVTLYCWHSDVSQALTIHATSSYVIPRRASSIDLETRAPVLRANDDVLDCRDPPAVAVVSEIWAVDTGGDGSDMDEPVVWGPVPCDVRDFPAIRASIETL